MLHRLPLPLDRVLQIADRETGCGTAQLAALGVIIYLKATTLTQLAAAERVSVPTASRIVDALVAEGLVERSVNPKDRRAIRLVATAQGHEMIVTACDRRADALRELLEDLTEDEWAALSTSVRALNRIFGYDRPLSESTPA